MHAVLIIDVDGCLSIVLRNAHRLVSLIIYPFSFYQVPFFLCTFLSALLAI